MPKKGEAYVCNRCGYVLPKKEAIILRARADKRIVIGRARPRFDSVRNIIDWYKVEDMPNLDELMDGITDFLHFYDQHFLQML